MNITLTLTASPELLAVLSGLVGLSANNIATPAAPAPSTPVKNTSKKVVEPTPTKNEDGEEDKSDASSDFDGTKEGATDKGEKTSSYTIEQVRAAVQKKSLEGKRDQVKALLVEFNVDKVTGLEKEQYAVFVTKVEAL